MTLAIVLLIYMSGFAFVMLHFQNPKNREDLPTPLLLAGIVLWPLALLVAAYIKIRFHEWK